MNHEPVLRSSTATEGGLTQINTKLKYLASSRYSIGERQKAGIQSELTNSRIVFTNDSASFRCCETSECSNTAVGR
jgi:hypothetical protein